MKVRLSKIFTVLFVVLLSFSSLGILSVNSQVENTWTSLAPMPRATSGIKAVVVNEKMYVMSGTFNYEYDPATGTWIAKKPMPTIRWISFALTACLDKIYVIGGDDENRSGGFYFLGTNEVYDPLTNTWETKQPMPTSREYMDANVVNGKIYVIGGMTWMDENKNYRNHTAVNEVYDPTTDSWSSKQPAPFAVGQYASAVLNNKIYIMGGTSNGTLYGGSSELVSNQIYDVETDTWSLGASIPPTKYSADAGVVAGTYYASAGATVGVMAPKRIYVIGGGLTETTNVVHVYDPVLDNWTSGAPMSVNRSSLAVGVVGDILYAMGGLLGWEGGDWPLYGYSLGVTNVVEQYTPFGYGTIPTEPEPELFPTILVIVSIAVIAVVGLGIFVYFKKFKN